MTHASDHPEIEALWRGIAGAGSVAIAAAQPGEGTSMVAEAIWRRAEHSGRTALLVHLNGAKPGAEPGRLERLGNHPLGEIAAPDAAQIAAWREPARLREAIAEWRKDWDLVVLDASPVLARGAQSLPGLTAAAAAEATLLVVLAGRTAASALREARERLRMAGANLVGVALNDRDNPSLAMELERQATRFARILPGLATRLTRAVRGSALLGLRV
jgi:hypothetical protein